MDKVISKVNYSSKKGPLVSLCKYLIVERGGKHYVLLKWFNAKNSRLTRLRFTLVEYDDYAEISSTEYDLPVSVEGEGYFGTSIYVRVRNKTKRIDVIIRNVDYLFVRYRFDDGCVKEEIVGKDEKEELRLASKGKPYVEERKFALSSPPKWVLIASFAVVLTMSFLILLVF